MRAEVLDLGMQLFVVIAYGLGALLFGAVGAYIDYHAILFATGGEYGLSLWAGVMGTTLLVMGLMTVRKKLIRSLVEFRAAVLG